MNQVLRIVREEWRYWGRSRLAATAFAMAIVLLVSTTVATWATSDMARQRRDALQTEADSAFVSQPDRHPHRMVHYGHYAFRTPTPLASLDPGIDAFAGIGIFLEGHRQNTAMFASAGELPALTRMGHLNPATVLQTLGPLLVILMGFSVLVRERENGTLLQLATHGVPPGIVVLGKTLALFLAAFLLLLPLGVGAAIVAASGAESWGAALLMLLAYALYLLTWCLLVTATSAFSRTAATSLAVLLLLWLVTVVALPRIASSAAAAALPAEGKIGSDLALLTSELQLADGHDAGSPAFEEVQSSLLAEYGVTDIRDLPFNYRGITARQGEAALTETLNLYAEQRMAQEREQAALMDRFGWLTPTLLIRRASMAIAGTDLAHHQRFLREAEALRFDFVQGLNTVHAEQLSYADDVRRSIDAEAERRTRVSAQNWAMLDQFRFAVSPLSERATESVSFLLALVGWLLAALFLSLIASRRLQQ